MKVAMGIPKEHKPVTYEELIKIAEEQYKGKKFEHIVTDDGFTRIVEKLNK